MCSSTLYATTAECDPSGAPVTSSSRTVIVEPGPQLAEEMEIELAERDALQPAGEPGRRVVARPRAHLERIVAQVWTGQ
jgi:hypothetical protein